MSIRGVLAVIVFWAALPLFLWLMLQEMFWTIVLGALVVGCVIGLSKIVYDMNA